LNLRLKFKTQCRNEQKRSAFVDGKPGGMSMTHAVVTKIVSLAAMVTLLTVCVLVAVPKGAGGKLGPPPSPAAVR
jgi:hypothetical protein